MLSRFNESGNGCTCVFKINTRLRLMSLSLVSCKSRRHDTPQTPLPPTSPRGERRGFWSRPTAGVVRPPYGRRFTLRLARAHRDAFSLRSTHRSMCAQLGSRTASRLFALSLRSAQQHERRYVGTTAISGSTLTALQRVSPPRPSRGAPLWDDEARRLAYTLPPLHPYRDIRPYAQNSYFV